MRSCILLQATTKVTFVMFELILFEPEIPPNTGNIIRLCANTGTVLHLVRPLGFELDEPRLKRAGLDYREFAEVRVHDGLTQCLDTLGDARLFALHVRPGNPRPAWGAARNVARRTAPQNTDARGQP